MKNDDTITVRVTSNLKNEVAEIAKATERSASKALILLLKKGIAAYRQDGILLDTRTTTQQDSLFIDNSPKNEQAKMIAGSKLQ